MTRYQILNLISGCGFGLTTKSPFQYGRFLRCRRFLIPGSPRFTPWWLGRPLQYRVAGYFEYEMNSPRVIELARKRRLNSTASRFGDQALIVFLNGRAILGKLALVILLPFLAEPPCFIEPARHQKATSQRRSLQFPVIFGYPSGVKRKLGQDRCRPRLLVRLGGGLHDATSGTTLPAGGSTMRAISCASFSSASAFSES